MSSPRIVVHPDLQALADAAAARLAVAVIDAQAARGVAHVSMTGGSMGSQMCRSLATLPARHAVDWSRVHVWWGDERYLPAGDPDRNDAQNEEAGLGALGLDPAHVHRVPGPEETASVEQSAAAYAATLRSVDAAFDVVILGVGPDGHIASLFPGHPSSWTARAVTVAVRDSPKPPPTRVSLSVTRLCRSREVWFLVAGADKADAVRRGLRGASFETTPAAHVHGEQRTLWLVDADAASGLAASG